MRNLKEITNYALLVSLKKEIYIKADKKMRKNPLINEFSFQKLMNQKVKFDFIEQNDYMITSLVEQEFSILFCYHKDYSN